MQNSGKATQIIYQMVKQYLNALMSELHAPLKVRDFHPFRATATGGKLC